MRKMLVVLSCLWTVDIQSTEIKPYIVNGHDVDVSARPSFANLFYDRINYDGRYGSGPYCGATLLNSQYVLTAAHCVYGSLSNQLFTSVVPQLQNESDFPYSVLERVMVNEYFYPTSYNNDTLANDIAILKLASPITIVAASDYADLPEVNDDTTYRNAGQDFFAVGHGNTQTGIDAKDHLQQTQLRFVSNYDCDIFTVDTSANLCMKGASSAKYLDNATCQGDSGGPLYWNGEQVGITSFGPTTCGNPHLNANSIFTEVLDHKVWIDSVLAGNETPKVTVTDAQRNAYLNPNSGGSGGGSLGISLFTLISLAGWRRGK
ncbi:S1 family peptidase [Vibrio europaeus]|uniref:S1 family peptidase n=1 Tax=Vibrio europaeus TaxID=300876 RepID=UPI00148DC550|nr:trypsin-like serine protease [Vibrio europaeus]MDC5841957.1 trypsin-like serine protease [Vibrio europaeus]